jgi:5-oxoprolinase (ATP-hydrolysing) subunit A
VSVVINCDMGEAYGMWRLGDDEALMPRIEMANVACGFHAGDPIVMRDTVALAKQHGVRVGAHPSFPDLQGFGRRAMDMEPEEVTAAVLYQVGALRGFLEAEGMELSHIKPHGALYGRAAEDETLAEAIADAALVFGVPILGMIGLHEQVYVRRGLEFLAEYYADLEYDEDGSLIITRTHEAMDAGDVRRRVTRVLREGVAETAGGGEIPMRADCVCIHSDTPGAVELAEAVKEAVAEAGASPIDERS